MRKLTLVLLLAAISVVVPSAHAAPPDNDDFANAIELSGPLTASFSTTEASVEPGEPILNCDERPVLNTVWYRFSPEEDSRLFVDTLGSDFDTVINIFYQHDGLALTPFGDLWLQSCEDEGALGDEFDIYVPGGETYFVQIGGHADVPSGTVNLQVRTPGSIAGKVTNSAGTGLQGICIEARSGYFDEEWFEWHISDSGWTRTGVDGSYEVRNLGAGEFQVFFYDCHNGIYLSEHYDDATWDEPTLVTVEFGQVTSGIDAQLEEPPPWPPIVIQETDLAITALTVENIPLTTDNGDVAHTGVRRKIHVDLANLSDVDQSGAELTVRICPKTRGSCRFMDLWWLELAKGSSHRETFDWTSLDMVGDVEVDAVVAPARWSCDTNPADNVRETSHYSVIGGTGSGYPLRPGELTGYRYDPSYYFDCSDKLQVTR